MTDVIVTCAACGETLSFDDSVQGSYCPWCGTRIEVGAKPPKPYERRLNKPKRIFEENEALKKECVSCGAVVDLKYQYCPRCGARYSYDTGLDVAIGRATYVGGCSELGEARDGMLVFSPSGVFLDASKLDLASVKSVEIGGGQVTKSKVAATLAFGVLGGLAAKGAKDRVEIAVHLKSGGAAFFVLDNKHAFEIRASLAPLLTMLSIPFADEVDQQAGAAAEPLVTLSLADELTKLAKLQESGFLTAEEVTAAKAKLLS
jgi:predicted RNA-binding Zn-ribbon protein involved in translation (DUF1610 family)